MLVRKYPYSVHGVLEGRYRQLRQGSLVTVQQWVATSKQLHQTLETQNQIEGKCTQYWPC